MARIATRHDQDALDIVQDAMYKLAERYAGRPAQDWAPLFHRILQTRITDWQRRSRIRRRFAGWLGRDPAEPEPEDPIQAVADERDPGPDGALAQAQAMSALDRALGALPLRQQQAFLLRAWEGLDVRATAAAMRCSQGSVKTHYSRALRALRRQLGEHWP